MTKGKQILKIFSEQLGLLRQIAENDALLARSVAARNLSLHNVEHHRGYYDTNSALKREEQATKELSELKVKFRENQTKLDELVAGAALEIA